MKCLSPLYKIYLAILLLPLVASATVFYVDGEHAGASDSNPGTSDAPWKTIDHAAQVLVAGDTVYIRGGVYGEAVQTVRDGNRADGYIVFAAYPGEQPIIDGTGVTYASTGFVITNDSIKVLGLEFCNWNTGIWMGGAGFVEIADCQVHNVVFGVGAGDGTHDFVLNRVVIHHFDLYGFDASPSGGADCYNGTLNDCIAHTARDPEQNVDGFALGHGTQHSFAFNGCIAFDVFDGFDISSRQTTLDRCLAYDCWNGAYKLWQDEIRLVNCIGYNCGVSNVELDWDGQPGTSTLVNCTFYQAQSFSIWVENAADTLEMVNCIIAGGDNIGLAFEQLSADNYRGDYNLFQCDNPTRAIAVGYTDEFSLQQIDAGAWTTYSGQDAHSHTATLTGDIFVNAKDGDFHLLENSPAVDNGTAMGAPGEDYDGLPRPSGTDMDIGAYEYPFSTRADEEHENEPASFTLLQNYPNPFNPETTIRFNIKKACHVQLQVYDLCGRHIATLVDGLKQPGHYETSFDGSKLPSGIYFYQIRMGDDAVAIKKMTLVK